MAGEALAEVRAPVHVEAAVGRLQRRGADAARGQQRHPGAIGAQRPSCRRPAPAPRRRHRHGLRRRACRSAGAGRRPPRLRSSPASGGACGRSRRPRATDAASAQQRCGLHVGGEDPSRAADEGLDAEAVRPLAQRLRAESGEQRRDVRAAAAVAGRKAGAASAWVRFMPPLPAIRNLRPTEGMASNNVTARPLCASRCAAIRPAGPPPTTATARRSPACGAPAWPGSPRWRGVVVSGWSAVGIEVVGRGARWRLRGGLYRVAG